MNRLLLASIFLTACALNAAAQRVSLKVLLSPPPILNVGVPTSPPAHEFPIAPSPGIPSLAPAAITALPAALYPAALAAAKPVIHQTNSQVIDSLRKYGAESGNLSRLDSEVGAAALENNFLSAASLGDDALTPPTDAGSPSLPATDSRSLRGQMLERVRLDDRGRSDEKQALDDAFLRLLGTPTGRHYAEEFLAEGLTAHVHFTDFPDSQLLLLNGRTVFRAAQAYTHWRPEGYAEVHLNRHYVDGDPDILRETLPAIVGHELLGHGLWYGRAAKENLYIAFHYHELNETMARLVGWSIDHELNGRFEEIGVWNYLADPSYYLSNLKMRLPYYAVTFGQREMADPLATLRARLNAAEPELERARRNLASQKTWLPVLEYFTRYHGIPAKRFEILRKELSDLEAHYQAEIVNSETVIREVSGLLERLSAEPDQESQRYLKMASEHPFFTRLSADAARLGAELQKRANTMPHIPPRPAPPRPADQITWQELRKMYEDDLAADAHRNPKRWR